jgi:1,4-dihydroxy-2-naphthoate octaprenyltransferase
LHDCSRCSYQGLYLCIYMKIMALILILSTFSLIWLMLASSPYPYKFVETHIERTCTCPVQRTLQSESIIFGTWK